MNIDMKRLRDELSTLTPLYKNPSLYFKGDERVACLFKRDHVGNEALRIHGDNASEVATYARIILELPAILDRLSLLEEVAKAANEVAKNYCSSTYFMFGMDPLADALARLDGCGK